MRIRCEHERGGLLVRFWDKNHAETAYAVLGVRGLQAEVEFPSDWHETRRAWVCLGFGLLRVAFSFPWRKVVPDEHQCSGPTYGFTFFEDGLHLHWGKCKGRRGDPMKIVPMPWAWRHCKYMVLSEPEKHPYTYLLRSGERQECTATIYAEKRVWARPWLPWKRTSRAINVTFSKEVGERSGSWKGGVIGCGYEMRSGEKPVDTLRRMERERVFN